MLICPTEGLPRANTIYSMSSSCRVFFWVQHLRGVGHLRRAAAIAKELATLGHKLINIVSNGQVQKPFACVRGPCCFRMRGPSRHQYSVGFGQLSKYSLAPITCLLCGRSRFVGALGGRRKSRYFGVGKEEERYPFAVFSRVHSPRRCAGDVSVWSTTTAF